MDKRGNLPRSFMDALSAHIVETSARQRTTFVAIDGLGCSGKSTFAEELSQTLGRDTIWTGTDDFFAEFRSSDWDESSPVRHLRWSEMLATLDDLRESGEAVVRSWDWKRGELCPPRLVQGGVVLFEGLHSLEKEIVGLYDLRIWVEGRMDNRLDRLAARDGPEVCAVWQRDFIAPEQVYLTSERPWEKADVVVAGADLTVNDIGRQLSAYLR